MCHQNTFELLPRQFSRAAHIKTLEELCNLQVKGLTTLLSVELRNLTLDFLHHLHLAFEKFCKATDGVVARLGCLAIL